MNRQIAARQFFILTFGLTVGTSIIVVPAGLADTAREDAWLGALVALAINLIMVALYWAIARLYPGKTLFAIHELVFGKWAGKALTAVYIVYFLILAGTLLGNLGFFLSSEMLTETPLSAIQILYLAAVAMCARLGVVILARVGELMLPWIVFFFLVLVITLLPQVDWNYAMPVLDEGIMPSLAAGYHSAMFQEVIVLMMFLPLVKKQRDAAKGFVFGTTLGGLALAVVVLLSVLVLGIEQTANDTYPTFALAKTIQIGNFLQRIEGILITIWILTFFIKISLLFIAILTGLQTIFRLRDTRPLIVPLAALVMVTSYTTYLNAVYVGEIIAHVWSGYSMLHLLLLPLALYAAGLLRRLFRRRRPAAQ